MMISWRCEWKRGSFLFSVMKRDGREEHAQPTA